MEPVTYAEVPANVRAYMAWKGQAPSPVEEKKGGKKKKEKKDKTRVLVERDTVNIKSFTDANFGDLPLINSSYKTDRQWVELLQLNAGMVGQHVWLRARVNSSRSKGNMSWLLMRRGVASVQALVMADKADPNTKLMVKYAGKIPPESVVDIYGEVVAVPSPITSATQSDVEVSVKKIYVVSPSIPELPFQLEDASRPEMSKEQRDAGETEKDEEGVIRVGQNIRLNNRWLDLRTNANNAIFKISSRVCQFFREYLLSFDFVEIQSPKIIPGSSEGGAEIFKLDYFGRECCLAQSPQLYKQMAVVSDLMKVFEIGPVFRAENSNTARHMCEFHGLDLEMEIKEHYHEVLLMLGNLFVHIFDNLNKHCKDEIAAVRRQYPAKPLRYKAKNETLVIDFRDAVQMLKEAGEEMGPYDDFSTPHEKKLGALVAEKYGTDFYICDKYPLAVRPFYTMPCPMDSNYSNSYDAFIRGEEITSGAQRIHDVPLLKERANVAGIPLDSLAKYIESFSMGAFPHGGCGIGLERVVMLFLGLDNIRKSALFPRTPDRCTP